MIKLALCQIRTELDWEETMNKTERMIREAAANGADFAVLPEMFSCPYSRKYFHSFASAGHESTIAILSALANELGIYIVGGTVPEIADGKLYNTCFIFDREGRQIARHRKMHLFDSDSLHIHESHTFSPGNEITVFDTEFGKMGCAVCFDVRFAELFRAMAMRGAKLIFLPAQFNTLTGPVSWELLIRSRASDNQMFVVGTEAARYEGFSYECWGHSMVADPYGAKLAECDEKEQVLYVDIDLDKVETTRAQFPVLPLLRRDVYSVAE